MLNVGTVPQETPVRRILESGAPAAPQKTFAPAADPLPDPCWRVNACSCQTVPRLFQTYAARTSLRRGIVTPRGLQQKHAADLPRVRVPKANSWWLLRASNSTDESSSPRCALQPALVYQKRLLQSVRGHRERVVAGPVVHRLRRVALVAVKIKRVQLLLILRLPQHGKIQRNT